MGGQRRSSSLLVVPAGKEKGDNCQFIYWCRARKIMGFSTVSSKNKKWDVSHHSHGMTWFKLSQCMQRLQRNRKGSPEFSYSIKYIQVNAYIVLSCIYIWAFKWHLKQYKITDGPWDMIVERSCL